MINKSEPFHFIWEEVWDFNVITLFRDDEIIGVASEVQNWVVFMSELREAKLPLQLEERMFSMFRRTLGTPRKPTKEEQRLFDALPQEVKDENDVRKTLAAAKEYVARMTDPDADPVVRAGHRLRHLRRLRKEQEVK